MQYFDRCLNQSEFIKSLVTRKTIQCLSDYNQNDLKKYDVRIFVVFHWCQSVESIASRTVSNVHDIRGIFQKLLHISAVA